MNNNSLMNVRISRHYFNNSLSIHKYVLKGLYVFSPKTTKFFFVKKSTVHTKNEQEKTFFYFLSNSYTSYPDTAPLVSSDIKIYSYAYNSIFLL